MNGITILTAICSLLLISVGADKFLFFLEPPCSLMNTIPSTLWKLLGVIQIAGGLLIWLPKYRRFVAGFFVVFMLFFSTVHLVNQTYDIGGSVSLAVLFALLLWNPKILRGKSQKI